MGNHPFLGLFLPQGLNYTNDGLPAGMNGNVLHCDLLRALPAMAIERVEQHCEGARELPAWFNGLLTKPDRGHTNPRS
jgi:hypothetical protein